MSIKLTELMIPVGELKIGMHVIRLDCPWADTNFLIQGFVINDIDTLNALVQQCDYVYIESRETLETVRKKHLASTKRVEKAAKFSAKATSLNASNNITIESLSPRHSASKQQRPPADKRITYINKISTENALPAAKAAYTSAKKTVENFMDGIRVGNMIDMHQARDTVNEIVDDILKNKDAMAWLTKIKNKDAYTAEHSLNVSILSATFARHLGHTEDDIRKVALGALLHDLGKAKIPIEILNKEGRFTDEEYNIMKEHPQYGRDLLMSIPKKDHFSIDIAYCHHERIDGLGYPRNLNATQIPYFAKLVSITDAYDAITSNRCYDKGRASMAALDIIYKCKGTQFDDELAVEFIKCIGVYPPGSLVELNNGEVGIVIETHENNKLKPRILLVLDRDKKEVPQKIVDLNDNIEDERGAVIRISRELINGQYGIYLEEYVKRGLLLGKTSAAVS